MAHLRTILAAVVFAGLALAADPCNPRQYPVAGCKTIVQQSVDAVADFRGKIAEESALIVKARARFFATYPDKPGAAEAGAEFAKLLDEKDCYYLWIYLNDRDPHAGTVMADPTLGKRVFDALGGKLDEGIRQSAFPEFYDWAMDVRRNVGTIDITNALSVPARLMKALPASAAKYDTYLQQRDWAEFDAAGREPAGLDDPAMYYPALCVRFQEIPWTEAFKEYHGMVKALGQDVVKRAVEQVRAAPRDAGGRLLAVNTRDPVKRGPGGALVDDNTVPQPEGVIGVWASPTKAVERLAIQGDDRRYLLSLLSERMGDFHLSKAHYYADKWPFAETTYHRYAIAFGEPVVLEAARKVRTAVKRMTDGYVMDPKAIGAGPRAEPYAVFETLVSRKDARGYVRSLLTFHGRIDSAADVDTAYQKLISASSESAVLTAARKMAADEPYPASEADFNTLNEALKGTVSLEKPAVMLVDDADYLSWKGFSANAKATYVTRPMRPSRPGSKDLIPGKINGRQTYTLRSINDKEVQLWRTSRAYDPDGAAHPARDEEVSYRAKSPQPVAQDVNSVETGEETLDVGGKKVSTRWLAVTSMGGKCHNKTWTSDEVPGGLVRQEDSGCYDLGWLSGTMLESFEGTRQPGVTTPFIVPAVKTPLHTPASSAAPAANAPNGGAALIQPAKPAMREPVAQPTASPTKPVTMTELGQHYVLILRRAEQRQGVLNRMEERLKMRGAALQPEAAAARTNLNAQLQAAKDAINRGDQKQAAESLQLVEGTLQTVEKLLGR